MSLNLTVLTNKILSSKADGALQTSLLKSVETAKNEENLNPIVDSLNDMIKLQITEDKSRLYRYSQSQLESSDHNRRNNSSDRKVKDKLKQQQEIFNRSLERTISEHFGNESLLSQELASIINSIQKLEENLKAKKNQLLVPKETIDKIEDVFISTTSMFWDKNIKRLNEYYKRNTEYTESQLVSLGVHQELRAFQNSSSDHYLKLYKQSIETDLTKINSEIGKKRVGDYLMRARMFPMYILMGSSMLGISINRGAAAKFIAPVMIFLMGLGFYLIYVSREKEEKDEKEKALATIKEKLQSETKRRAKGFSDKVKEYSTKEVKRVNEDLNSYFDNTLDLKEGGEKRGSNKVRDTRIKLDMESKIKGLENLVKDLSKLKT